MQKRKKDSPHIQWQRVALLTFFALITGIALLGLVIAMIPDPEPNQLAILAEFERETQFARTQTATPPMATTNHAVEILIVQTYAAEAAQVMVTGKAVP